MSNDLIFKYGTKDIPDTISAGTVYIKKTADSKAQMFVDAPVKQGETPTRLQVGGEIYIGDPDDEVAGDYEIVMNPEGEVLEGIVTGLDASNNPIGYKIRVITTSDPDNYTPTDNPAENMITLVVLE